jgi:hypothetical protein
MVVLATRPSSRRTEISSQKITTVMLEPIQEDVESDESVMIP